MKEIYSLTDNDVSSVEETLEKDFSTITEKDLNTELLSKLIRAIKYYKSSEITLKEEINRLKSLLISLEKKETKAKDFLLFLLYQRGLDRFRDKKTQLLAYTSKSTSVDVYDLAKVPDTLSLAVMENIPLSDVPESLKDKIEYKTVDKKLLKDLLKSGEKIDGVELREKSFVVIK